LNQSFLETDASMEESAEIENEMNSGEHR